MFKNLQFTAANISILINNFVMYSAILFVPILLDIYKFNVGSIGILLFYFSLSMSVSSWLGGRLANKFGKEKVISLSFLLSCFTVLSYFGIKEEASYIYIMISLIFGGLSAGVGVASMQAANMESVTQEKSGVASGIYSTFRYIGGMMASAVVSIAVGTNALYIVLLVFSVAGLFISIGLTRKNSIEKKGVFMG
jgi:predicted MFS family arabinose efflux permease